MRVHRGLLGWGIFFVVLGAVPLAVRGGLVDESVVSRAWELWPLILIGIGVGLVLRRTPAEPVGGLVVAVTAGLMFGSLIAAGAGGFDAFGGGFSACGGSRSGTPFADQRGTLAASSSVELQMDCGDLTLGTGDGDRWQLTGTAPNGDVPDVQAQSDRLRIAAPDRRGFRFGDQGSRWNVTVPRATLDRLDISVNAGSARANLAGTQLGSVSLSVNAGSAHLDLSGATRLDSITASANAGSLSLALPAVTTSGDLSANAGSLELCVPDGVGLRITVSDNTLASNNFGDRGLQRSGDTWTTPGADGSTMIRLDASANLGSITLNPEGGCD